MAILGGGGREHALAWRVAQSDPLGRLFCLPGNPGTNGIGGVGENAAVDPSDTAAVLKFCRQNAVQFVVVGPEEPLANGVADALAEAGVKVFGPSRQAAKLEADKAFAKELMRQQSVPTAESKSFTRADAAAAYVERIDGPCVVKAAGLAAGKGVSVCYRTADALEAVDKLMRQKQFGDAGATVVVEDLLTGPEVSVLAFVDRRDVYLMDPCQDHKPVDDGDTGPMTGGMGAYCPADALVTPKLLNQIQRDVIVPVLDGLARDGVDYKGVLYAGLMLTDAGPKVLEFNVRFGDPETQPLMMRWRGDLLSVLLATADGTLADAEFGFDPRPAVCVVASAPGYPTRPKLGGVIEGVDDADAMRRREGVPRRRGPEGRRPRHQRRPGAGRHGPRHRPRRRQAAGVRGDREGRLRGHALPPRHRGAGGRRGVSGRRRDAVAFLRAIVR